jgi:hypothetical protein
VRKKKKKTMAKWSAVCCPKDQLGLSVHDLEVKNRALLVKWNFKLLTENEMW